MSRMFAAYPMVRVSMYAGYRLHVSLQLCWMPQGMGMSTVFAEYPRLQVCLYCTLDAYFVLF